MMNQIGLDLALCRALVWQIAWQSTAVLALGLVVTSVIAMRPSRAHWILLASALLCLVVPPTSFVARRLNLVLFSPEPAAFSASPSATSSSSPTETAWPEPRLVSTAQRATELTETGPGSTDQAGAAVARPENGSAVLAWGPLRDPTALTAFVVRVWIVLTAVGFLRFLAAFARAWRLVATASRVREPDLLAAAAAAARALGLNRMPEVRSSLALRCPVVWCWGWRPVLVLPEAFVATGLDARDRCSAICCHELAHWKRADHLSALATELLTCLLPWQLLAWAVRARMADLAELACDDWALTHARAVSPPDYAEALLRLTTNRRRPLVPAAVSSRPNLVARVRHILEESKPMPRTGRLWTSVVACASLGLIAAFALAQTRQSEARGDDPPAPDLAGQDDEVGGISAVEGTVHDRDDGPLDGVEVFCVGEEVSRTTPVALPHGDPDYGKRRMKVLARGRTDARGHFSLRAHVDRRMGNGASISIVAHKPRLAPNSAPLGPEKRPLDIILETPVPIRGRILTPGGEPAPGVAVRLEGYGEWKGVVSSRWMEYGSERETWETRPDFYPGEFRTDTAGRFVIDGFVPKGVFASLVLRHPEYAVEDLIVATGENPEPTPALASSRIRPLSPDFTHTLAPARPVFGTVTDAETGAPLAGVMVEVSTPLRTGNSTARAVTDGAGRYRVSDRAGETFWVKAHPESSSGYVGADRNALSWLADDFDQRLDLAPMPGSPTPQRVGEADGSALRVDLGLRHGVMLRGRVVDAGTGDPVPNVGVAYQPTFDNPNVRRDDDFRSPALTDADGRFALVGARGPGVVVAEAPDENYLRHPIDPIDFGHVGSLHAHGFARLAVPAEGDTAEVLLTLKKGVTLEARVVRPDGSSAEGVKGWCPELTSRLLDNWVQPVRFPDGVFRLMGAEPGRSYHVFFLDRDNCFGTVAELTANPGRANTLEVRLQPTASLRGRILSTDGKPLEGAQIFPWIQLVETGAEVMERDLVGGSFKNYIYFFFTSEPLKPVYPADFHYTGLIPGVRYVVSWSTRADGRSWKAVDPLAPGEERNLGDIRSVKKRAGKIVD
jgi:beta-lactamase regulating signal transducer with metallopeptidase domain